MDFFLGLVLHSLPHLLRIYLSKEPSLAVAVTQFTNAHPLLTIPHSLGPDGPNCSFLHCLVAARKRYAILNHPTSCARIEFYS